MTAPKEAQEAMQRLHILEQNVQSINSQKQQFAAQIFEIEGALKELSTAQTAYKIVGGLMISSDKPTLEKELASKKEMIELRVLSLEKQEKQIKDKAKKLHEEALAKPE